MSEIWQMYSTKVLILFIGDLSLKSSTKTTIWPKYHFLELKTRITLLADMNSKAYSSPSLYLKTLFYIRFFYITNCTISDNWCILWGMYVLCNHLKNHTIFNHFSFNFSTTLQKYLKITNNSNINLNITSKFRSNSWANLLTDCTDFAGFAEDDDV